jgi:hypothetical protein
MPAKLLQNRPLSVLRVAARKSPKALMLHTDLIERTHGTEIKTNCKCNSWQMGQDGGAICGALRQTESAAHEGRCGASQVQTGNVVGAGVRASPSDSSNADRSIQFRCVSVREVAGAVLAP